MIYSGKREINTINIWNALWKLGDKRFKRISGSMSHDRMNPTTVWDMKLYLIGDHGIIATICEPGSGTKP